MNKAIVVEAPDYPPNKAWFNSVFLAGGITNVRDWQKDVIKMLSDEQILIFNPRRTDYDMNDKSLTEEQIRWEHFYLRASRSIIFWFSHETVQPITLFELGAALERGEKLFIGCDPRYTRIDDVRIQSRLMGYKNSIFNDIESLVENFKKTLTTPTGEYKL